MRRKLESALKGVGSGEVFTGAVFTGAMFTGVRLLSTVLWPSTSETTTMACMSVWAVRWGGGIRRVHMQGSQRYTERRGLI